MYVIICYHSFHQLQKDVQRQHRRHESSRFDSRSRRQGRPQVDQDVQAGREKTSGKNILLPQCSLITLLLL